MFFEISSFSLKYLFSFLFLVRFVTLYGNSVSAKFSPRSQKNPYFLISLYGLHKEKLKNLKFEMCSEKSFYRGKWQKLNVVFCVQVIYNIDIFFVFQASSWAPPSWKYDGIWFFWLSDSRWRRSKA